MRAKEKEKEKKNSADRGGLGDAFVEEEMVELQLLVRQIFFRLVMHLGLPVLRLFGVYYLITCHVVLNY